MQERLCQQQAETNRWSKHGHHTKKPTLEHKSPERQGNMEIRHQQTRGHCCEQLCCQLDGWLRFRNNRLEADYWNSRIGFLCKLDAFLQANTIIHGIAIVSELWRLGKISGILPHLDFLFFVLFLAWLVTESSQC